MHITVIASAVQHDRNPIQGPNGQIDAVRLHFRDAESQTNMTIIIPAGMWPAFVEFVNDPEKARDAAQARAKIIVPTSAPPPKRLH